VRRWCVEPGSRRPIVGVAKDETFPRDCCLAQESENRTGGFCVPRVRWRKEPNEWDAEEAKFALTSATVLSDECARERC